MQAVDLFGEPIANGHKSVLAQSFDYPPFSVLNAREGWWQERKRQWLALGIKSEEGRDIDPTSVPKNLPEGHYMAGRGNNEGGSIFDPVLTELFYRWFTPPGGLIADPFAGGSVRGVVAGVLGYGYKGFELRGEQVDANRAQAAMITPEADVTWQAGDSAATVPQWAGAADFLFSCPPYGDLEVYSDDPTDISGMDYPDFLVAYRAIIAAAVAKMKDDSFAAFVVGDFRDKKGFYRNFVSHTIDAFIDAGAGYYNEAILVTCVGTLPIRIGRQFRAGRKLGKTHQNIVVFCKGNPKRAAQKCEGVLE
jgi:hypothetical protein